MTPQDILSVAIQHHQAGRFGPAEASYRQLLALNPKHADALHLLGVLTGQQGKPDQAVLLIQQAIALAPAAPYYMNLAESFRAAGLWSEALTAYEQTLKLGGGSAEVYHARGLTLDKLGMTTEAIAAFRQAVAMQPTFLPAYQEQWAILMREGRPKEAAEVSRRAVAVDPKRPLLHAQLGSALSAARDDLGAIDAFSNALKLQPNWAQVCVNLAENFHRLARWPESSNFAARAIQLDPGRSDAYGFLGFAREQTGHLTAAIDAYRKAVELRPQDMGQQGNLAGALLEATRFDESVAVYRNALAANPANSSLHSDYLLALNYLDSVSAPELFDEHKRWAAAHAARLAPANPPSLQFAIGSRPLRVGYLSPDLREHPVSMFIRPLLSGHDRSRVHPIIYCDSTRSDGTTDRLKALVPADDWRTVHAMTDDQLADQIRRDRIDILIDLAGHTGRNRLTVFERKPAPVQATYLGYPNTTGLPREIMQYRLTDALCDPPGFCDAMYTEELVRLAAPFLCYHPPVDAPAVSPVPSESAGFVMFGSFNAMQKVSPTVLKLWSNILSQVPGSRLVLKNRSMGDHGVRQTLRDTFAGLGIEANRLVFVSPLPTIASHLARYSEVDIALDSYPYHGTTTTCDALWMGVPVVTLAGQVHRSRVGVSLLTSVGMEDLIAETSEQYVELAVVLAQDVGRRQKIRAELRDRMRASPLIDSTAYVRKMEAALEKMWTGAS